MITIRRASHDDQQIWDDYVNQHDEHSPYHLFAWQYAVQAAYQHRSHYLIAEKNINNTKQVVGVLPLIIFTKPLSKPSLCALPFCDVGGAISNDSSITEQLIAESNIVAKNLQAKFIEIRSSGIITENAEEKTITVEKTAKVSMLMSLPETSELLFSAFKSKLRSQIRKAEKNGLHYKIGSKKVMLDDFYQVFSHNMRALGSPVHAKQWFEYLLDYYQEKMIISIVYKDQIPIGAGIVLIAGSKAAIPWASTKTKFNRLSPNMMLYWSLLKYLTDNGIDKFDFGRSSFGEGTYKFKQQWGAKPVALSWKIIDLESTSQEAKVKAVSNGNLRSIIEKIWRKIPIKITILIGPTIRKYISL
jgi:FemAB-related protein (PEP-CTERM system-associated)